MFTPGRAALERAPEQLLEMVPILGHVIEVRPVEFARGRRVEQQTVHVGT